MRKSIQPIIQALNLEIKERLTIIDQSQVNDTLSEIIDSEFGSITIVVSKEIIKGYDSDDYDVPSDPHEFEFTVEEVTEVKLIGGTGNVLPLLSEIVKKELNKLTIKY